MVAGGVSVRRAALALLVTAVASCNDELVEDVSPDVCASGKRWVGEFTADEEMFPGQDCVGCHRSLDGPPLMAAGTVYGVPDPEGARTTSPYCFGVEGVRVTITGADGTVLQTHTNRAGNFYFEGAIDALPTPFSVELDYTRADGRASHQTMTTQPSYGGCGRCHDPAIAAITATPGALAGGQPAPDVVIGGAFPIYTGPVEP